MYTVEQALRGISMYPLPSATLDGVCIRRGLSRDTEATTAVFRSAAYRLAEADVLTWLAAAPNISQGGQNYAFTDEQRKAYRARAAAIFEELGDLSAPSSKYGYKGNSL